MTVEGLPECGGWKPGRLLHPPPSSAQDAPHQRVVQPRMSTLPRRRIPGVANNVTPYKVCIYIYTYIYIYIYIHIHTHIHESNREKTQGEGVWPLGPVSWLCPDLPPLQTSKTCAFSGLTHQGSIHHFPSRELPLALPGDAFGHFPRDIILRL